MAHPKDVHYWGQLRTALTSGSWDAPYPGKAPNGSLLSWSELLRKFNKHCHGYTDVAELASQTQALSLLVEAGVDARAAEGGQEGIAEPLTLGEECILPQGRRDEVSSGYTTLKALRSADEEVCRSLAEANCSLILTII